MMRKAAKETSGNEQIAMVILAIALCAAALWAISCGGGGAYSSTPTSPSTPAATPAPAAPAPSTTPAVTVNIVSSSGSGAFSPNPAQAASGANVAWKNNSSNTHVLVMNDGRSIGTVAPGATVTMTFSGGNGDYHCVTHPSMVGSINGATTPASPTGGGSDY
jgi:plastocyanin